MTKLISYRSSKFVNNLCTIEEVSFYYETNLRTFPGMFSFEMNVCLYTGKIQSFPFFSVYVKVNANLCY